MNAYTKKAGFQAKPPNDNPMWYYKDPSGNQQGPFNSDRMLAWFDAGYFTTTLWVRLSSDLSYVLLNELIKRYDNRIPFSLKPDELLSFPRKSSPPPRRVCKPPKRQDLPGHEAPSCLICNEEHETEKYLSCGSSTQRHSLCEICIQKLTKYNKNGDLCVECPQCRLTMVLPNGGAKCLPTKFFVTLSCEDCSIDKEIKEQWWCKNCESTICGNCAMRNHRIHECRCWENYDVPSECLAIFNSKFDRRNDTKAKINQFCDQLKQILTKKLENVQVNAEFADGIEQAFGNLQMPSTAETSRTKLEKKVKLTLDLLQRRKICPNLEAEQLAAIGNDVQFRFKFPDMNDVVDMFREK